MKFTFITDPFKGIDPVILKLVQERMNAVKECEYAEKFTCKVIQPGLVSYEDTGNGVALVTKEAIDKMSPSFVGKPVIDEVHKSGLTPDKFRDVADGVITNTYWSEDGWMCYDVLVWDKKTKEHMRSNKYYVSNAYIIKKYNGGGVHNAIPYDQEVVEAEGTHLAIVKNPRYNGAAILLNSITGGSMAIKAFLKRVGDTVKNAIDPSGSTVEIDGQQIPIATLIEYYKKEQEEIKAQEAAAAAAGKAGSENKLEEIGDDSTVPVEEKDVKISDMINCYKKRMNAQETPEQKAAREKKEAEEKAAKEKAKEGETEEEKKVREKKEADEKAALEKKNADEKETKEKKDKDEKDERDNALKIVTSLDSFWTDDRKVRLKDIFNCLVDKEKTAAEKARKMNQNFMILKEAANARGGTEDPVPNTAENRRDEGKSRYGSAKQGA